ncbi:hypothetical protein Hanom_Chr02g00162331 [Helianthus anomalus]
MLESGEKIVLIKPEYVEKVTQIFQKHLYGYFVGTVWFLVRVRMNLYRLRYGRGGCGGWLKRKRGKEMAERINYI